MTPNSDNRLEQGIAALKAGQRDEARQLLLQLVEAEEHNEQAWLWLSGAVDTDEERRICLENVLALNPNQQTAKYGLEKLGSGGETAVPAPSPSPPTPAYNDIWDQSCDICAYCAHPVTDADKKCLRCNRSLYQRSFRYQKPDVYLHLLWILLVGLAQLYFLQAIYNLVVTYNLSAAILPAFLMTLCLILAAGVYFRQYWAYLAAILLLLLILSLRLVGALLPAALTPAARLQITPILDNVLNPAVSLLGTALHSFQFLAIVSALVIAIFKTAPDFERINQRLVATTQKGLQSASSYHAAAKRAAQQEQWATAVLNWQHAAAKAPGSWQFQRQLGIAYARLGFYQRSADILQNALPITPDPAQQANLNRLLAAVQKQLTITQIKHD
ncbi:MAG: hypothetical protein R6X34_27820 [Chloroflexota bacterium]